MDILFLGASNTDASHCFTADNLGNGYVKYTSERLFDILSVSGYSLHVTNGGTDGFTFPRIYEKWKCNYSDLVYDMIVLLGGINEVGMIHNTNMNPEQADVCLKTSSSSLTALLHENGIQKSSHIILMEPFLFRSPQFLSLWIPTLEKMRSLIRNCIDQYHGTAQLHFLPLQQKLEHLAAGKGLSYVSSDGIHLTKEGHQYVADILSSVITEFIH